MKIKILLVFTIFLIVFPNLVLGNVLTPKIAGLYSNLTYNDEGGDLLGMEIFVFLGDKRYYALVQESSGEPSKPHLLPLTLIGEDSIRINYPPGNAIIKLEGTIYQDKLVIRLHFKSHTTEPITLKRGNSYWQ